MEGKEEEAFGGRKVSLEMLLVCKLIHHKWTIIWCTGVEEDILCSQPPYQRIFTGVAFSTMKNVIEASVKRSDLLYW